MKKIYLHKAKTQIARPNTIRDINRQIVLNYVRDRSPISRAEIARQTNLQRSTVSSIIDSLQKAGLIESIGQGTSTGGRKPTLLKIKTGFAVALGVDLTPRKTTIAVADLSGKVLEKTSFKTSPNLEYMTEQITKKVTKFAKKYDNNDLEIGMSIPGITDQSDGEAIYVPYFQWQDWNIAEVLSEATGLSVTIDNDANAIAMAELWFGREVIRKVRNFITVLVGEGVGTGIIFDGQVYRGEKGAAGEFGHMIIGVDALVQCSCGSRSCWEAHASENAVIARYQKLVGIKSLSFDSFTIDELLNLAKKGDENALKAFQETTKYLGIGISNLILGLSPQAVVVSGNITKIWDSIYEDLEKTIEKSIRQRIPDTMITASSLRENPTLLGSLSLVLARKFASAS